MGLKLWCRCESRPACNCTVAKHLTALGKPGLGLMEKRYAPGYSQLRVVGVADLLSDIATLIKSTAAVHLESLETR